MIDIESKEALKDPAWRLDNLYYISGYVQTPRGYIKRRIKFNKNGIQQRLDSNLCRLNKVLKSRQCGISTYFLLKYLDMACFEEHVNVAIVAHELKSLRILMSIIRYAYRNMNDLVRPSVDKGGGSMYQLYFPEMNSKIYCTLEAVSDAVTHLHISEMALMDDQEKVNTSLDSVALDTGNISIETTPRGFNHFYDFWQDDNGFKGHFFPWYLDPRCYIESSKLTWTPDEIELGHKAKRLFNVDITDGQIAFRRAKVKAKGSLSNFLQEYPEDSQTCFISSGNPAIDLLTVQNLLNELDGPINENGDVKVYKEYQAGHNYVIGADVAEGVGKDWSVAVVMDAKNLETVAVLRCQAKPYDFAHKINELAEQYTYAKIPPLLAVERNNHGHAVLLELQNHINYKNLYIHKDDKAGWLTDKITRPLMIDAFVDGVENRTITIYDRTILQECLTLIDNKGKFEAAEGKHDDCIIACSIALQMCINFSKIDIYENIEDKFRI